MITVGETFVKKTSACALHERGAPSGASLADVWALAAQHAAHRAQKWSHDWIPAEDGIELATLGVI